jgi:hypothetical protein
MLNIIGLTILWISLMLLILPRVLAHPHAIQPKLSKSRFNRQEAQAPGSQRPTSSTPA